MLRKKVTYFNRFFCYRSMGFFVFYVSKKLPTFTQPSKFVSICHKIEKYNLTFIKMV